MNIIKSHSFDVGHEQSKPQPFQAAFIDLMKQHPGWFCETYSSEIGNSRRRMSTFVECRRFFAFTEYCVREIPTSMKSCTCEVTTSKKCRVPKYSVFGERGKLKFSQIHEY